MTGQTATIKSTPRTRHLAAIPAEGPTSAVTEGRYRVLAEIGRGGMGVVYKAHDRRLNRMVALKVLPAEWNSNEAARKRLVREAHAVSAIDHPNICTIYDIAAMRGGRLFLVMAYYDGETLGDRMRREPLGLDASVAIGRQVANALAAAHARGIVHCDVKPGNVFLCRSGIVKVLDFGLACRLEAGGMAGGPGGFEVPGRPLGTASYMAPERILQMSPDAKTDVFSLGVMLYEMAARRKPFDGESPVEIVMNVLDRQPVPLHSLVAGCPARFNSIVLRAMEKNSRRRPTAAELSVALSGVLNSPHLPLNAGETRRCPAGGCDESEYDEQHVLCAAR